MSELILRVIERRIVSALLAPAALAMIGVARAQVTGGFSGLMQAGSVDTYGYFGPTGGTLDGLPFELTYAYVPSAFSLVCDSGCKDQYQTSQNGVFTQTLTVNGIAWTVTNGGETYIDFVQPGKGPGWVSNGYVLLYPIGSLPDQPVLDVDYATPQKSTLVRPGKAAESGPVQFTVSDVDKSANYPELLNGISNPTATINFTDPKTGNVIDATHSKPLIEVVVGEQISLNVVDLGLGPTVSYAWEVTDGMPVGGYTPTSQSPNVGQTLPLTKDQATFTFYWTAPSTQASGDQKDSFSVKVTFSLASGQQVSGEADFIVDAAPSAVAPVVPKTTAVACSAATATYCDIDTPTYPDGIIRLSMGFGSGSTPNYGFEISTATSAESGYFQWVQLINQDTDVKQFASGKTKTCSTIPGLDGSFPYHPNSTLSGFAATDSPQVALVGEGNDDLRNVSRSFSATMYLMWISSLQNSIPVSVGSVTWSFAESTKYDTQAYNGWNTPAVGSSFGKFVPGTNLPLWKGLATEQCGRYITE